MTKKTKIIIISSIIALIALICIIAFIVSRNSQNTVSTSYFIENKVAESLIEVQSMDKSKPIVVMFHAPYCINCHRFMPAFNKLTKDLEKDYNFLALNIEDPANYPLVDNNVQTLPSLYIFDVNIGNKIRIPLDVIRSYKDLKGEFDRYTRIRSFIDLEKAEQNHKELMDTYAKNIKTTK